MTIFDKNRKITKSGAAKTPDAGDNEQIHIEGLERYAALSALKDEIENILKIISSEIKEDALALFVARGAEAKARPPNLRARDGAATAIVQLKRLPAKSAVARENLLLLKKNEIPWINLAGRFVVNPNYTSNGALLEKAAKALVAAKIPEDFILYEEEEKITLDDNSIDAIFKLKDRKLIEKLLPIATTIAISDRQLAKNMNETLEIVSGIIEEMEGGGSE